jgi:hypothetical protein
VIAAVYTSRNEADIVECSLRHMLAEGIDLILVADNSEIGEGTRSVLMRLARETGRVEWTRALDPIHRQPELMSGLANEAAERGATWVIASDVDELWYSTTGVSIAEFLSHCSYDKLYARVFQHHDWNVRCTQAQRLPKVAFRPPGVLTNGNHDVEGAGPVSDGTVLEIRELQYRGFEHFKAKAADRAATLDPAMRQLGDGSHHTRLEGMTDDQLHAEWEAWLSAPTVHDPIPSRTACRPASWSPPTGPPRSPTPACGR